MLAGPKVSRLATEYEILSVTANINGIVST